MRRFIQAEPLYQVGYLIGGRQILALHDEMVGPGKLTERQFHDAVLKQGPMPIELLRGADRQEAAERCEAVVAICEVKLQ